MIGRAGEQADIFNTGQLYKGKQGLHVAVFRARVHLKIDSFLSTIEHGITNFAGQFGGIEPPVENLQAPVPCAGYQNRFFAPGLRQISRTGGGCAIDSDHPVGMEIRNVTEKHRHEGEGNRRNGCGIDPAI